MNFNLDKDYLISFFEHTQFPKDGANDILDSFLSVTVKMGLNPFPQLVELYTVNKYDAKMTQDVIDDMSRETGVSDYTIWIIVLILSSRDTLSTYYKTTERDELVFWNTFCDIKYKAIECRKVHGIWGTFVPSWYSSFFRGELQKIGRLEYQDSIYRSDKEYVKDNIIIKKGAPIKSIHIPSSAEDFSRESRMQSYKAAYDYYKQKDGLDYLICVCYSWLLFTPYKEILPEHSNIRSFMSDFDIIDVNQSDEFDDAWRVFYCKMPYEPEKLPEDTMLQKIFKKYILEGGTFGGGTGILIFDGDKIVNA